MIVVDGRVFSTDACDRGMGRYVKFLLQTIASAGYDICLILYKNSRLKEGDPLRSQCKEIKSIEIDPAIYHENDIHQCSYAIEEIIKDVHAVAFFDATPFFLPMRLDITECPVIAIVYDLIPLKHPEEYIYNNSCVVAEEYENGLRRLMKADFLIAISHYSKAAALNYLGIEKDRIEVIYPCLEKEYFVDCFSQRKQIDFFAIIGSHTSKHPLFALTLYNQLNVSGMRKHLICAPTASQLRALTDEFVLLTRRLAIQSSISEQEKILNQAQAKVVFHLSKDEGFGIPLLEAVFKHTRVICCDIRINREILERSGEGIEKISMLISTNSEENKLSEIENFIDLPDEKENDRHFQRIKDYFLSHWMKEAPVIIKKTIETAAEIHRGFLEDVVAKMVSNTPKDLCGVADYAYSIPLGTNKNMIIYTADVSIKKTHASSRIRLKSHLCFVNDLKNRVPTIFHLAVSDRLWFGLELMRLYGSSNDVAILHDHAYLYGIYYFCSCQKKMTNCLAMYFVGDDSKFKEKVCNQKYMKPDEFNDAVRGYQHSWLRQMDIKLISHLTTEAEAEFALLGNAPVFFNKQYVEISIDDRASPMVLKIARAWRAKKRFSCLDFVVGVFGSVTNNKYIVEISSAISKASQQLRVELGEGHFGIHFLVCGVVHDPAVLVQARAHFEDLGLNAFFHHENPLRDQLFDGIIAASDMVISCRKQDRGQVSHLIPRSLCLGKPVLTNSKSGYSMIQGHCTIDDAHFESELLEKILYFVKNREELQSISRFNRRLFMEKYDITQVFNQVITSG